MDSNIIGTTIDGRFHVTELLGSGSFGTVYKAEQPELSRVVALKLLQGLSLNGNDARVRFNREAKLLASLRHDNIVSVFGSGMMNGQIPYLTMEYLSGKTVDKVLSEQGPLSWQRTVAIGIQICAGLQAAHNLGIIHRDVNPCNVMLLDNEGKDMVKILDFGLSTVLADSQSKIQRLTMTGEIVGTLAYMSPEATIGSKVDQRADIYSLGCLMYECLANRPAFDGDDRLEIMQRQYLDLPVPLRSLPNLQALPKQVELVIFKCLQKQPEQRFQSAQSLSDALLLLQSGRFNEIDTAGVQLSAKGKADNKTIHSYLLATAIGIMVLAAGAMAVIHWMNERAASLRAQQETPIARTPEEANRQYEVQRAKQYLSVARDEKSKGNLAEADHNTRLAFQAVVRNFPEAVDQKAMAADDVEILKQMVAIYRAPSPTGHVNVPPMPHASDLLNIFWARNLHDPEALTFRQNCDLLNAVTMLSATYGDYLDALAALYTNMEQKSPDMSQRSHSLMEECRRIIPEGVCKTGIGGLYFNLARAQVAYVDGHREDAIRYADLAWQFLGSSGAMSATDRFNLGRSVLGMQLRIRNVPGVTKLFDCMEEAALSIDKRLSLNYPHSAATMRDPRNGGTAASEVLKLLTLLGEEVSDYPALKARVQNDIARVKATMN